jgi:hypothetical protein
LKEQVMNFLELVGRFCCEERCRAFLEALRWSESVRCLRCDSDNLSRMDKCVHFICRTCR